MDKSYGYQCQPSTFTQEHLLYPLGMGYIVDNPCFCIERQSFPQFLTMSCISGKLHISQYGESLTISNGDSCVLRLEDYHKYYSDELEPCEIAWLHFGGNQAKQLLETIAKGNDITIIKNSQITLLITKCMTVYVNDYRHSFLDLSEIIYKILISIMKTLSVIKITDKVTQSPLVQKLDEFIFANLEKNITLDMLAGYCHLNNAYLCRRFRSEAGVSPIKYVMNKK